VCVRERKVCVRGKGVVYACCGSRWCGKKMKVLRGEQQRVGTVNAAVGGECAR